MIDPSERAKGGFGFADAKLREHEAARQHGPTPTAPSTDTLPADPVRDNASLPARADRANKTTKRPA
jgi:hypothetical protein